MDFEIGRYYHLYNRSNNRELVFKKDDNYLYFLRQFRSRFRDSSTVFAYCLMPAHFHFLVRVDTKNINKLKQNIGIHLSSYTKAINKVFQRNGSLFQNHTKSKLIDDRTYLITLLTYIHQNPVRSGLMNDLKTWDYSSYPDLGRYRDGTFVERLLIKEEFISVEDIRVFSNKTIVTVDDRYWV